MLGIILYNTIIDQRSFKNYINSANIKKLCLINCELFFNELPRLKIEDCSIDYGNGNISVDSCVYSQDMTVIFNTYIFPFLLNLEYIEIKNLIIKGARNNDITAKIKFPLFNLINITCDFDEYYNFIDRDSCYD